METMMEALAAGTEGGIRLGSVDRIEEDGTLWIRLSRRRPMPARWIAGVTPDQLRGAKASGASVLVALAARNQAVVIGIVVSDPARAAAEARLDGKKVILTGEEEVTLKCGKASITLTSAGKVLIKGEYVVSRSSGVNRIKGGAVQSN